ncbi:MAG TPA: S53 family peptidase [Anaeromyxobacteraceae bacterium]|nr:S53 family peptidase [Anaeromyxobacteraceae bacterium]
MRTAKLSVSRLVAGAALAILRRAKAVPFVAAAALFITPSAFAQGRTALQNHVPGYVAQAKDLGASSASTVITLQIWLHPHDEAGLEAQLGRMEDPASQDHGRWLSAQQYAATHAPSDSDVASVTAFAQANNLQVLSVGPDNGFVTVQGKVADAQAAFGVQLHDFQWGGRTLRATIANPSVPSALGTVVAAVGGLSQHTVAPHHVRPKSADGVEIAGVPLAKASPNGFFYSSQCFREPETHTFTSSTATATYWGNRYGQDITNSDLGTLSPCGYQPSDIWGAYDLNGLYGKGLDGTGQTIAIVDAYGSTTIQQDAATFSGLYGLPPPDITIVGTPSASPYDPDDTKAGWATETTLDVEWAHAIAPGAKIVLVVTSDDPNDPTNTADSDVNLAAAIHAASKIPGVSTISNSYGSPESQTPTALLQMWHCVIRSAAARGISVNFSSGDSGDFSAGTGPTDVSSPASDPAATSVGGVSAVLKQDGSIAFETGWGTNITRIADPESLGSPPVDPPLHNGFLFGAGGGPSGYWWQPRYQWSLPGKSRLVPDISWVADPYTGVEIVLTYDDAGDQTVEVIGGTSLSTPMFSGLWAIANQSAGRLLGSAAPRLYKLQRGIVDVRPFWSRGNVAGFIKDASGTTWESSTDLLAPLFGTRYFVSALYQGPSSTRWYVLSFGTDTTLKTRWGWDEVTGLGTPRGQAFVRAVSTPW